MSNASPLGSATLRAETSPVKQNIRPLHGKATKKKAAKAVFPLKVERACFAFMAGVHPLPVSPRQLQDISAIKRWPMSAILAALEAFAEAGLIVRHQRAAQPEDQKWALVERALAKLNNTPASANAVAFSEHLQPALQPILKRLSVQGKFAVLEPAAGIVGGDGF